MTPDEQLQERALKSAIREARERGWLAPGERVPMGDEPPSGGSVMVAMLYRRYIAHLRGERGTAFLGGPPVEAKVAVRRGAS